MISVPSFALSALTSNVPFVVSPFVIVYVVTTGVDVHFVISTFVSLTFEPAPLELP